MMNQTGKVQEWIKKPQLGNQLKEFEGWYVKKRDQFINKAQAKNKVVVQKVKNFPGWVSGMSSGAFRLTKGFLSDTGSFFTENYKESRDHVKEYFKKNKKYFAYRRKNAFNFLKRQRRGFVGLFLGTVFVYAVGSNIPKAVAYYKLNKKENEN